jgi:hypothetical protein
METGPLPDWFEALKTQFADNNRVPPVTPDYSTMNPRMSPTEWNNFTHFASQPPGVTLNRSGGARFSYLPSDLPPNTEPWFRADYGGGFSPPTPPRSGPPPDPFAIRKMMLGLDPGTANLPPDTPIGTQPNVLGALAQRYAGAVAGPVGAGLIMAMQPTSTAPRSMDEAPRWSWPTGTYSP